MTPRTELRIKNEQLKEFKEENERMQNELIKQKKEVLWVKSFNRLKGIYSEANNRMKDIQSIQDKGEALYSKVKEKATNIKHKQELDAQFYFLLGVGGVVVSAGVGFLSVSAIATSLNSYSFACLVALGTFYNVLILLGSGVAAFVFGYILAYKKDMI